MRVSWQSIVISFAVTIGGYSVYNLFEGSDDSKDAEVSVAMLLTIASGAISWVISDFYARDQKDSLIDTTAERSSEKILNQSKQIWDVEQYLREQADNVGKPETAQAFLAAGRMLNLIRSSNNTYIGDWEGLVSEPIRQKMSSKSETQNQLFRTAEAAETGGVIEAAPVQSSDSNQINLITAQSLPTHLRPNLTSVPRKVTVLDQFPTQSTKKLSVGSFRVRLNEPRLKFNFTGKLDPQFDSVPDFFDVKLIQKPHGSSQIRIKTHAATGTIHDFHVHVKSEELNVLLPQGDYEFEYEVKSSVPQAVVHGTV